MCVSVGGCCAATVRAALTHTPVLDGKQRIACDEHRTELHFVRCIKPNNAQAAESFDAALVLHQLRCCGVTEIARVARAGFPTRYAHSEFAQRFATLLGHEAPGASLRTHVWAGNLTKTCSLRHAIHVLSRGPSTNVSVSCRVEHLLLLCCCRSTSTL